MESVAIGLLALARCEGGLLPVQPTSVPLASLIEDILQPCAAEARAKRLSISVDVPAAVRWFTDRSALRSILTNLLANAISHSPAGAAIHLRIERHGDRDQLLLTNGTDNLTAADLPHLFERFWRKDPARSASAHSGLGLALSQAYARSLGLALRADLNDRHEITFTLSGARRASAPGERA